MCADRIDEFEIDRKSFAVGGIGTIHRCKRAGDAEKNYVAKKVKMVKDDENRMNSIRSEKEMAILLSKCKSHHLLKCEKVIERSDCLYIITKFCNSGDLEDHARNVTFLAIDEVQRIFRQISEGLAEIHSMKIAHRDMKAGNVFLHRENSKSEIMALIADFGFSKVLNEGEMAETILGTVETMAPELLHNDNTTGQVDIWAMGTILYRLCFGKYPFMLTPKEESKCKTGLERKDKLRDKTIDGKYTIPANFIISVQCINLIEMCMQTKPENRPAAELLMHHLFLNVPIEQQDLYWTREEITLSIKGVSFAKKAKEYVESKYMEPLSVSKKP